MNEKDHALKELSFPGGNVDRNAKRLAEPKIFAMSPPVRGRGSKLPYFRSAADGITVAPVRGAWIETTQDNERSVFVFSRPLCGGRGSKRR